MMSTPSLNRLLILVALTLILVLKVAFDVVIKRREGAAQIRGVGEEGDGWIFFTKYGKRDTRDHCAFFRLICFQPSPRRQTVNSKLQE